MFDELRDISPQNIQIAEPRIEIARYVEEEWRHHILVWATPDIDSDREERLAECLACAVSQIGSSVRMGKRTEIVFGQYPYFAIDVGTGVDLYVANQTKESALASSGGDRVYVDAWRIFDPLPTGGCDPIYPILEEFVHLWMNIRSEALTAYILNILNGPNYRNQASERLRETKEGTKTDMGDGGPG